MGCDLAGQCDELDPFLDLEDGSEPTHDPIEFFGDPPEEEDCENLTPTSADELETLWDANAFGNLDDFDRDDMAGEAERLLAHWTENLGWTVKATAEEVARFVIAKMVEKEESCTLD